MNQLSHKRRSDAKKLDKLRLLVGQEILRYALNTKARVNHICVEPAHNELYEQYCLKLFLNWLATKQHFPVYKVAIQPACQASLPTPGGWPNFNDRYPFYAYFDSAFEKHLQSVAFAYLDGSFEPELTVAGDLYMRMLGSVVAEDEQGKLYIDRIDKARRTGQFYTSAAVVDYCLETASIDAAAKTVLDPACGSGNFLLGALRRVENKIAALPNLHGFDIDARAVQLARVLLLLACSQELSSIEAKLGFEAVQAEIERGWENLEKNIRCGDATMLSSCDARFSAVVGNPPYVSFGSRNQTPIAPSHAQYLRRNFAASAQYKIRLHSVFQELSLSFAENGGDVVMLLPDAFLTGAFYEKLRTLIVAQAELISFAELPESTFADATAGRWCIAHYRKRSPSKGSLPLSVGAPCHGALKDSGDRLVNLSSFNESGPSKQFSIPQRILISPDKSRFRLLFDQKDVDIVSRLDGFPVVAEEFSGHTGIRARNGQESIVADKSQGAKWSRGIASGAEVTPHRVEWRGRWLHVEPSLLYGGGFDPQIIGNPKVLVRQTADRLIGALDNEGFYHLNNVHSFAPKTVSLDDTAFLAALMNSRLWLYLYQLKSRESKRALAQIDIEMVESMPLAPTSQSDRRDIAAIVRSVAAGDSPLLQNNQILLNKLDSLIYDIYRLSSSEVKHVEATSTLASPFVTC